MSPALTYQKNGRRVIVAAFGCAIAIHAGAFALSAGHAASSPIVCILPPAAVDIAVDLGESPPPPLEIPIPDAPSVPNIENDFHDETRPVVRAAHAFPVVRAPSLTNASFANVKASVVVAPRPDYPYEARRRHETGSGVVALQIDAVSGAVMDAVMTESTGSEILDRATLNALRRWRFKPRTPAQVKVPITFALNGVSF